MLDGQAPGKPFTLPRIHGYQLRILGLLEFNHSIAPRSSTVEGDGRVPIGTTFELQPRIDAATPVTIHGQFGAPWLHVGLTPEVLKSLILFCGSIIVDIGNFCVSGKRKGSLKLLSEEMAKVVTFDEDPVCVLGKESNEVDAEQLGSCKPDHIVNGRPEEPFQFTQTANSEDLPFGPFSKASNALLHGNKGATRYHETHYM